METMCNELRKIIGCLLTVIALPAAGDLGAVPILGSFDWDPYPGTTLWTSQNGWSTVSVPSSGGNNGGWLEITFPATANDPPNNWYDVISAPATNLFVGQWNTNMWLQFDFWESNLVAGAVQIRWESLTNDFVWSYSMPVLPATNTWGTLTAPLSNWADWEYPGATASQYLSDLQTVDWVGIYIYRDTGAQQVYGVDNFMLMVPEPAEWVMLAAALVGLSTSLRRRRGPGP